MVIQRLTFRNLQRLCLAAAIVCSALTVFTCAAQRGLPAQDGILNFGRINSSLYRGAQPDAAGLTNLARLGVKTILNLRMPNDVWHPEEACARTLGIFYTNIPMAGVGRPTEQQVRNALAAIEKSPGPVFVHCQHGCDRTGTIIACYRIQHDHWSAETALQEAIRYGISKLERGMKSYILEFTPPPARQAAGK